MPNRKPRQYNLVYITVNFLTEKYIGKKLMIKFLMSVVTAIASFVGLLGISHAAIATPVVSQAASLAVDTIKEPVNLNTIGSLNQLTNQDTQEFFAHLGCSCATCTATEYNRSL